MQIILLKGAQGTAKSVIWAPALKLWCEAIGLTVAHVEQIGWHDEEYRTLLSANTDIGVYETHSDVDALISSRRPVLVAEASIDAHGNYRLTMDFAEIFGSPLLHSLGNMPNAVERGNRHYSITGWRVDDLRHVLIARHHVTVRNVGPSQ